MSKMVRLWDDGHKYKQHVVPEELAEDLTKDLTERSSRFQPRLENPLTDHEGKVMDTVGLDDPGMVMTTRSTRTIQLDGIKVEVPCQDWYSILSQLKSKPERIFASGRKYYKMHHWIYCLVLTPEQRNQLVAGMEAQAEEAQKEGDADNERFRQAMREINKDGVKVVSARALALEAAARGEKGRN